jgi:hypothetical protein
MDTPIADGMLIFFLQLDMLWSEADAMSLRSAFILYDSIVHIYVYVVLRSADRTHTTGSTTDDLMIVYSLPL